MVYLKQTHCDVPDCPKPHLAKGYCRMHYYRLRNTGTTDAAPPQTQAMCSVDGCPSVVKSKGLCNKHYQQVRNAGSVQADDTRTPDERFWSHVDRSDGTDACWPWTGAMHPDGYGWCRFAGRTHGAHVVAWRIANDVVPGGLELDHRCHDPNTCRLGKDCPHRRCCNPAHLSPVTSAENRSAERSARLTVVGVYNGEKTHCPKNHPYDEANTYLTPKGERHCRTCNRETAARLRAKRSGRLGDATENCCLFGHEWTPENTYVGKKTGYRRCRACDRYNAAQRYRRVKPQRRKPRTTPADYARGERVHTAKITQADVDTIRTRYAAGGLRQADLAAEYGLTQASVSAIIRGKSWRTESHN